MKPSYLETIGLIERLHRRFLELVKIEMDHLGIQEINNVQGLILFNIGDAQMTVGELTLRGCYLGSNVSYNLKTLVERSYLLQERSTHDRRTVYVRLSDKGRALRDHLDAMHDRHLGMIDDTGVTGESLTAINKTLSRLDRFWTRGADLMQRYRTYAAAE